MSQDPEFKMSQNYEVMPPQKKSAYPILIEDWEHLKSRIRKISDNANFYHTIGSILLGVAGSALIAALTLNIPEVVEGEMPLELLVAWFIFASAVASGLLSLHLGGSQRKVQSANVEDVVELMEFIENKYETKT